MTMDVQVVVVGAGPVGLALAAELRLGGASVTVLERLAVPTTESRATTLHARTMEAFDQRGLLAAFQAPPNDPMGHFGGLPLDLTEEPTSFPGQWKVPQSRVEAVLAERALADGAEIRRCCQVVGVHDDGDAVRVLFDGPDGPAELRAEYLVGCDGEDSTVRELAGFELTGHGASRQMVRADVEGISIPNRRFERFPGGLAIAARRPDGLTRVMIHEFANATFAEEPDFAAVAGAWRRVVGEDISSGSPVWVNAFGNASRQVSRYQLGRVLLAGDAAHQQMPVGGQALNLGLQDAFNLGWKLAAQLTGRAPAGLLDTYHDERHAIGQQVLANIEAQAMLLLGGPEVEPVREVLRELLAHRPVRTRLANMITGLDVQYQPGDHPLVGRRMPQLDLHQESGWSSTAELVRSGRGVLLDLSGEPERAAQLGRAVQPWRSRVDLACRALLPAEPAAAMTYDAPDTVLIRPDGYVAWAGDRDADPLPALQRWFGSPEAAETTTTATARSAQETDGQVSTLGEVMTSTTSPTPASEQSSQVQHCDVVILGSGLAGSVSAAILARNGASVVLVDATSHPRYAIGESMTPQLVEWLHILAERYEVPEIKSLVSITASTRDIGPVFGSKAHFGFMKHRPGQEPDPKEATMLAIPKVLTQASHLFRQDSDSFMFHVAIKYGAVTRQNWRASDVDFDDDGVTVTGQNGEVFRGRYLIDGSGFRSPIAEKFGLRESPARFKHHSRSLFTHYIGIKPFDDVSFHPDAERPPVRWHDGTMHHIFDRGWFWIIPFDNYKKSKNPLCSVGLTFDERTYPKRRDLTPEQEFNYYLDMFPAVKRQFEGAHKVRDWVSTERLQYSSSKTVGDRWCMMSHAAGFIDPLFSRGLSNTFEVVDAVSWRLLDALKNDDFREENFEYVERLQRGLLEFNDDLVNSSFIAFSDFELWNAVFRIWGAFITPGVMRLTRARTLFLKDHDDQHFKDLEMGAHTGLWWPESHEFKRLLETTAETCEKYEVGEMDAHTAATIIQTAIQESNIVNPTFGWKDPDRRLIAPNTATMAKFMYWASFSDSAEMRKLGREFLKGMLKAGVKVRKLL